ncbi:MAG: prolyl oligopeptidase family serine peptidase [Gemmatimonadota bacterium]|nr:prolyl oligopeptidase family serine peptidase [Gemmatimonadota bacterium]
MKSSVTVASLLVVLVAGNAISAKGQASSVARVSSGEGFDFTIANIMRGPELYGRAPTNVRWSADGRWIHFQWNAPGTDWREPMRPYRVRAMAGATPERLTLAQADSALPFVADGPVSPDMRSRIVEANGDIYLVSLKDGTARRLTQTVANETRPTFSSDGRTIYFLRDNNAFALSLSGGELRQLTDIRQGPAPTDSAKATGQRGRLEQQQRELFDVVRDRSAADSAVRADRKAREAAGLQPIYLNATERVIALDVSPNGKAAVAIVGKPATLQRQAEVPQFITSNGYVENLRGRTKVGDATGRQRVLWISIPSGKATTLRLFGDSTTLGAYNLAGWNEDGSRAALFAFSDNHKLRLLQSVRSDSALSTVVETLRDSAWVTGSGVGGPCGTCAGFYDRGRRIWYVTEATGYAQLNSASAAGGDVVPLTSGKWEVLDVSLSPDQREFYLTTSEPSPFEQQVYRMPVAGGARTQVTSASGGHTAVASPDGQWLADVYSFTNRPPDLYLQANSAGASSHRLTTSPSAEWLKGPWIAPALVSIPASDGVQVPGHIYRPEDMGARPNGAAVLFVHGAGYLHNVGNFWSQYPREYMFNQFLAKNGYVVLDIDYRASAGYGRDWRTAIYRWMGGRDLQDEVDASKWLTSTYGIPASRVGMYGGSYGGFMTLMALFTAPDYFGAGAALRSVTDWAHYNDGYTSAILNRPQDDTLAYRRSSPIYFASGLRSPLLMAHGMVDQNVMYQDIVRLEQRLIELGKTNWSLASYPVEDHGFTRPSSWTDEYRRIFALFESTIARPTAAPQK